ncbi:MAG: dual specificity protein phosphatase 23 [Fimbriiglobus sp.]
MPPYNFSWIEPAVIAGLAMPDSREDLAWLRANGIEVLVSLTEYLPRREWINEAGLLSVHIPIRDMSAPTLEQFEVFRQTMERAKSQGMGVAVHCAAGRGRTGTMLAAHLITQGQPAEAAIQAIRTARPGSIETSEQIQALVRYGSRQSGG